MANSGFAALKFALSLIVLVALTKPSSSLRSSSSSTSSIYEVLRSHGLPIGLFPKGISDTNFTMDPTTGRFEVHLERSCDAKFETHVRYDYNVSGTLSYGHIDAMSGIVAQDLFLWFPVKGIRVDIPSSGLIYFDVGVVFKQFSLSLFETPRDCTVSDYSSPPHNDVVLLNDLGPNIKQQSGWLVKGFGEENSGTAAL